MEAGNDNECVEVEDDLSSNNLTAVPSAVLEEQIVVKLLLDFNDIDILPDNFGGLQALRYFSAVGNNLCLLPESFGDLQNLEELHLNENSLTRLPDSICKLNKLRIIKLTGNQLEFLPQEFGEITNLQVLHCDENRLKCLPKTFGILENLYELEIGANSIKCLSDGFGMLKALQVLNLSSNNLETLPDSFGNLCNLVTLDMSANRIKQLPTHFSSCHSLQKLYFDCNLLLGLPEWISDLKNIIEFSVKDNQFQGQALPDQFPHNCQKLKHLNMSGNFMSELPADLGAMKSVEFIHLGSVIGELERRNFQNGNWLAEIPSSICDLVNLRELYVDENQITDLPENFGDLVSLEILDMGQNLLHVLPDSFGQLRSLRVCMISKNHLKWLPSSFGDLSALEDLRLDDNELSELPQSFSKLIQLKTLDLFSNRLTEVPEALRHLTNLIRLDIDSNDFHVPLSEIPLITKETRYATRDPALKDNWRGRIRQDLTHLKNVVMVKTENGSEEGFDSPPDDLPFSSDVLERAAMRSMSIWKSHKDTSTRRRPARIKSAKLRHYSNSPGSEGEDSGKDGCWEDTDSGTDYDNNQGTDDDDDDDEYEPPLIVQPKMWSGYKAPEPPAGSHAIVESFFEETENWDEEIEENVQQCGTFNAPIMDVDPLKIYYPPVENGPFTFAPNDIHEQDYIKRPQKYAVEDSQFDNCDSDETEELNVNPVF
ncbi:leucine-rich repeat protein lrrA-like isoform X2 [Mya arenaria]|nr:leucine-rich repeat protein lrrA-like isoform X2 [Mya arenaria]